MTHFIICSKLVRLEAYNLSEFIYLPTFVCASCMKACAYTESFVGDALTLTMFFFLYFFSSFLVYEGRKEDQSNT